MAAGVPQDRLQAVHPVGRRYGPLHGHQRADGEDAAKQGLRRGKQALHRHRLHHCLRLRHPQPLVSGDQVPPPDGRRDPRDGGRLRQDRQAAAGRRCGRCGDPCGPRRLPAGSVHHRQHELPYRRVRRLLREPLSLPRGDRTGHQGRLRQGLPGGAALLRGVQDQGLRPGRRSRRGVRGVRPRYGGVRARHQVSGGRGLRYVRLRQRHLRRVVLGASAGLYAGELQPAGGGAYQELHHQAGGLRR